MAIKYFTASKKIKGVTYTAQFNGISAALDCTDNSYSEETGKSSSEKFGKYLFENVLVEPKLSINDIGKDKIGATFEKVINGTKYVAKFDGILAALRATDKSYGDNGKISTKKLSEYLFESVIVEPENLDIDDFASVEEFSEVVEFASKAMQGGEVMDEYNEITTFLREVMQGNFRPAENTGTAKKAGKK